MGRAIRSVVGAIAGGIAVSGLVTGTAAAETPAEFYKGRSIQFVVGYGPGGGYDINARLIARHWSRYIPGNPAVVVQNMPGAGSLRATNFLYINAPKDGGTVGMFARNMPLLSILGGNKNVQFDARRFVWIGSPTTYADDAALLHVRKSAAVKQLTDARNPGGKELVLGGTADGSTGNDVALVLRDGLGFNVKLISGYPDGNALALAVDRNELDGHVLGLGATRAGRPERMKPDGHTHVLLQFARPNRHPDLPNVPTMRELAQGDRQLALVELVELPYLLARPVSAPPDIPADRAEALRTAFDTLQKDPEYLADAAKQQLDISPIGGRAILAILERLAKTPPDVLDAMRKMQGEGDGKGG